MNIAGVIFLVLVSLTSYSLPLQAQLAEPVNNRLERDRLHAQPPKFPDNGAPTGRRRGGTSRDGCPALNMPLTALVPGEETLASEGRISTKFISKSFLASTLTQYPTFWFYIPQSPSVVHLGEFVLQNEAGDDVYRTSLTLPQEPGAIGISLPSSQQYALQIDKKYHWYFKVYCGDPHKTPEYFFVDGWVQRVALTPEIMRQLKMAKSARYVTYAANNIWYDALTNLAQLRRTGSDNIILKQDWAELLRSVGLQDFAAMPIVLLYNQLPNRM